MTDLSEAVGGKQRIVGGPFGSKLTTRDYTDEGVPVIRGSNMEVNGRWIGGDFAFVSDQKAEKDLKSNVAYPGDIMVTQRGTLGQVSIIPEDGGFPFYVVSQSQMAISVDTELVNRDFVYYFLRSPAFADYSHTQTIQTGVPHINLGILRDAPTSFPKKEVQREIATILGALDDKIELNRKTAATLEEMARALYRSWFVDFDPVHAKAAGRAPAHMDTQTAALFPDSFGEDGLPEGWELKRLSDLIKLNYGKALKKDLRVPGEFPVYGSGGIGGTHEDALVKMPTIIVGRKGTVGSLHWAPRGCWPIDTVFYVTSDYPLSFVMRLIGELPLADMNTDAAVPGLNRDNAYRLEIAFPGEAIVQTYSKLSDMWQQKIDQLEVENQTLATLRDTLLPRLMSGELSVGDAKKELEISI